MPETANEELHRWLGTLAPPRSARSSPAIVDTRGRCDADACDISPGIGWDRRRRRFVILEVDASEGGPDRARVILATPSSRSEVYAGEIGEAGFPGLDRALRPYLRGPVLPDITRETSAEQFSLNSYAPLVSLGAPLDGRVIYVQVQPTQAGADNVLYLAASDGRGAIELARTPAGDGDNQSDWWCEGAVDNACTPELLRALGRWVPLPIGIDHVVLSPNGRWLAVLGTVQVPGHGGYPSVSFVVEVPAPTTP